MISTPQNVLYCMSSNYKNNPLIFLNKDDLIIKKEEDPLFTL